MATTIRPIEAKSVHQIQSGQVIVDLCSVVKELVENSLDAGANGIEVKFKNYGLDEIEVSDNGSGIDAANYASVALKHHTSKLSGYDDLAALQTFGFRGEALASLCALSNFTIVTAQAHEAPKGNRLEFEISGKLKSTSVTASSKGTTATVSSLFDKLPVRRKELIKNIKREYGKVLGLMHAYACISTNVKFTVKNTMPKGKSMVVFTTQSNATTRENIANVYGAKTLSALVALELDLDFQPSSIQLSQKVSTGTKVLVRGHISKPVFGEGRQTPDRQMFFVNGRPCGLPQMAKAINEVYKSFNVSQSPFIFADFQMDTNAYDVNVSPDKRTIFLHDAVSMIESLKTSLTEMFDQQDHTVPQSQFQTPKAAMSRQSSIRRMESLDSGSSPSSMIISDAHDLSHLSPAVQNKLSPTPEAEPNRILHNHFRYLASSRPEKEQQGKDGESAGSTVLQKKRSTNDSKGLTIRREQGSNVSGKAESVRDAGDMVEHEDENPGTTNFRSPLANNTDPTLATSNGALSDIPVVQQQVRKSSPGVVQNAFDHMRPRRPQPDIATITIGDKTVTRTIGSQPSDRQDANPLHRNIEHLARSGRGKSKPTATLQFSQRLRRFNAPGSSLDEENGTDNSEAEDEPVLDKPSQYDNITESSSEDTSEPDQQHESDSNSAANSGNEGQQTAPRSESEDISDAENDLSSNEAEQDKERARVQRLIELAEQRAVKSSKVTQKRAANGLKNIRSKDSTVALQATLDIPGLHFEDNLRSLRLSTGARAQLTSTIGIEEDETTPDEEERLSLTVSKSDFVQMNIVGQFNLGFILAVRPRRPDEAGPNKSSKERDELFIIDQHASDEKYNFERLQAETVVGNQRMVRPVRLDLTAVEEEILMENVSALEKNGFIIDIDTSDETPVGRRCQLVSLPLSKEVVFDTGDLDELIHLLNESPTLHDSATVPRPSKVRKMFAMRACRSSIMIGKTLSRRQMSTVLRNMGSIDKPWNCPHGRPTMRHLTSLDTLPFSPWHEGDGVVSSDAGPKSAATAWKEFV